MPDKTDKNTPATLSRRDFLFTAAAALLLASGCDGLRRRPRIGVALGGGGAKGLAHIPLLETLDELEIQPHAVAGTSIGAIVGALYAAGLSGSEIRGLIEQFLIKQDSSDRPFITVPRSLRWLDFIDPELASGVLLDSSDFIAFIGETIPARTFSDLAVNLKVTATELWSGEPVVIESGRLLPALQASIAVPGVFAPVELRGRHLIDGGVTNPLPYDLLLDDCDIVIAIDVSGDPRIDGEQHPSFLEVLFHSFHTMSANILVEKLKQRQPDIYIRPEITGVRILEFYKAEQILAQAQPAKRSLKKALNRKLLKFEIRPGCTVY
jgi:NTE family protein